MIKQLIRTIDVFKSKRKIIKKAKKLGNNIVINDKVQINSNTYIGSNVGINGLIIRENGEVRIGNNVSIAKGCLILTGNHNYNTGLPYGKDSIYKNVEIQDNVWIGQNVIILGGVTIGEGAIIQAGSVVVWDVPKLALAGGNPARPFKYRDEKLYNEMKEKRMYHFFKARKKYMINSTY